MIHRTCAVAIALLVAGACPALAELPGDPDPTFNGGQPMLVDFARTVPRSTFLNAVTFDAEGRLMVAGIATDESGRSAAVIARLGADGAVDASFGTGGATVVQLGLGMGMFAPGSRATAIGPRPDGAGWLIAGGATGADERSATMAAAFDPNGNLDIGYGNGGSIRPQPGDGTQDALAEYGAIGADGSAYIVSSVSTLVSGANRKLGVSKVTSEGLLATGFGNLPAQASYVNSFSEIVDPSTTGTGVTITPDGVLVAAYTWDAESRPQFLLVRLTTAGVLDSTFGGGSGYFRDQVADPAAMPRDSQARTAAVGPDDEIYVAGSADDGDGRFAIAVTRLTPGGLLDGTFAVGGTRRVQMGTGDDAFSTVSEVLVQGDGRVVVVGNSNIGGGISEGIVMRLDTEGDLDPTFGTNGIVRLPYGDDTFAGRSALSPDGQSVVIAGVTSTGSDSKGFVARILLEPYTAPTTTTTTLPFDACAAAPSLAGVRCRLAAFALVLDAATAPGKLETKLGRTRSRADARLGAAESASGKALRRKLKKSLAQLRKLGKQLASKAAVRDIEPGTRAALIAQLTALMDELGALVAAA
ncbi:MAG TPA: hypothetical protein VGR62_12080 [Candidatus Binatia bacterium]|jgi:uncharacterized delta-60 repeat protein|nr:hypothetical protein [Candidatus Binatia bacterium]